MLEQLSQLWYVLPPSDPDEVDSAAAPSDENDNTDGSPKRRQKDIVDNGEDEVDGGFPFRLGRKPKTCTDGPTPAASALPRLPCYNMEHMKRGLFIIINNENFEPQTRANKRKGTDVDATKLNEVFTKIGFFVQPYKDLTVQNMKLLIERVAEADHSNFDCLGIAVLSHGTTEDVLYGIDETVKLAELLEPLKNCPSLNGKPKLIFIQACRGEQLIPAVTLSDNAAVSPAQKYSARPMNVENGACKPQRVPRHADFLYVHATPPGHFAWRNQYNGSWFIQALCTQVEAFAYELEVMTLLTLVNRQVAYDYQSSTGQPWNSDMKQVPSVISMLTKLLFFKPKN